MLGIWNFTIGISSLKVWNLKTIGTFPQDLREDP